MKIVHGIKDDDVLLNGLTKKEVSDRILQLRNYMPHIKDNIAKLKKAVAKESATLERNERDLIHYEAQLNELLDVYFHKKNNK